MPLRTSLHRKAASGRWSRKRKEVLSVNMISLPLADFRHLSHIGNDAHRDSFGDLSFLKMGHNLLLQSSQSEQNLFMACSPPPKPPRLNVNDGSDSPDRIPKTSQKRKKSNSMPLLDREDRIIEEEEVHKDKVAPSQDYSSEQKSLSLDRNGKLPVIKAGETQKDEDSGFNFSLDLGPSILDDVLQVMDKHHQ
ncbi:cdc42 effector protein 3 isoform 1-T2 [Synchiropus picturatus]